MRDRLWLHLLRRRTASFTYWLYHRRRLRRLDFKLQQLRHYAIYFNNYIIDFDNHFIHLHDLVVHFHNYVI